MEQLQSYYTTAIKHPYSVQLYEWIKNPYIITGIAVLVVVYGSFMVSKMPPTIAKWFEYPIVKIAIISLIVAIHRWSPMMALLMALVIVFSILTMTVTHGRKSTGPTDPVEQRPDYLENQQIQQELQQELHTPIMHNNPHPDTRSDERESHLFNDLHPMNRPTEETPFMDTRVLDPDDPTHPGWKVMNDPKVNTAIYELNPPFARKELPTSEEPMNQPSINVPLGGPTRYSAYHGYKITN